MVKKGNIICIEGIDGSGKGCQTQQIVEYLESKGIRTAKYSFPRYNTTIGKVIARYLQGEFGDINNVPFELICIAYAADRKAAMEEIWYQVTELKTWVILDRFTYSNLFTAAKLPREKWSEFIEWIERLEFDNLRIVPPFYNFYLYVDPEISIQRITERGKREYQDGKVDIHEDNFELLRNTAKCYLEFAKGKEDWFIIDQMKDGQQLAPDQVFKKIKEKLDLIIKASQ